jgi:hypothetical protein
LDVEVPISREFMYPRTENEEFVNRWSGRSDESWLERRADSWDCLRDSEAALRRLAILVAEYGFEEGPWASILKYFRLSASIHSV